MVSTELSPGEWTLDTAASSIGFQAKAAFGIRVNGRFDRYESAITVGPSVAESAIRAIVWTDSVDTGHQDARRAPRRRYRVCDSTVSDPGVPQHRPRRNGYRTQRQRHPARPRHQPVGCLPRDAGDHNGTAPLQRHRRRVAQGVWDQPTRHHQGRHGHPRRHPEASVTGVSEHDRKGRSNVEVCIWR